MKKGRNLLVIFFFLSFFFLPIVIAQGSPFQQVIDNGCEVRFPQDTTLKQSEDIDLHIHAINITTGSNSSLNDSNAICFVHIYNPTGSHIIEQDMAGDSNNIEWELEILGGNFTTIGDFPFYVECQSMDSVCAVSGMFKVTPTGFTNLLGFYIIIISISIIFLIFGFWIQDPWVVIFGTFGLFFVGLYILLNGIDGIRNLAYTRAISFIIIGIAAYISIKAAGETLNG